MSGALKNTTERGGYKHQIDVYDETSNEERTLTSITYLGDIGTKTRITIKVDGMHEPHIVEIKSVKPY